MLGNFQQSQIRIEVAASATAIRQQLLSPVCLRQWLAPAKLSLENDDLLRVQSHFSAELGPIKVEHLVTVASIDSLRLILSAGIDGYQEWYWGDGWLQSRLEGISMLPLGLLQNANLTRLRWALTQNSGK
jgi:hypothetical protein